MRVECIESLIDCNREIEFAYKMQIIQLPITMTTERNIFLSVKPMKSQQMLGIQANY